MTKTSKIVLELKSVDWW